MLSLLVSALAAGGAASPIAPRQAAPVIFSCSTPGTVALTFDDGPFAYTDQALDLLANAGLKATFFLNGQNWANINDYASTVQRMDSEGHQIGSHTFTHADLATLDPGSVTSEMTQLEDALLGIIGKFPTYMRPPYFSYSDQTLQTLGGLGYTVIHADIDTLDYENNSPDTIGNSIANYENGIDSGGSISLAHDVHQTTVEYLIPAMIDAVQSRGLTAVTVGECLGDPASNWYRTSRDGGGNDPPGEDPPGEDPPPGGNPTPDGSCGGANGYTCPSGYDSCCSQWGYCGDTAEHCGAGCNPNFGICW